MVEHRCKTCRHFKPEPDEPDWGACLWTTAVPYWLADSDRDDTVSAENGLRCEAWLVIPSLEAST